MENIKEYFLWVKIARQIGEDADADTDDAAHAASAPAADDPGLAQASARIAGAMEQRQTSELGDGPGRAPGSGGRPPPWSGGRPPGTTMSPLAEQVFWGGRPPGIYAGATMAGWWGLDKDYSGTRGSGTKVEIAPFIGTRAQAVDWLDSSEGRKWEKGSITFFLITFANTGEF